MTTNSLDIFLKSIAGAKTNISDFIPIISGVANFSKITNLEVILNSWNNILSTPLGTYLDNPDYGSELYKYVFEPQDLTTVELIKNEINDRLMAYDNRAIIKKIDVVFYSNMKGFEVNINVSYSGEKGQMTLPFLQNYAV